MAEVLTEFAEPIVATDGRAYHAQATGALLDDGMWEGWIEFVPLDGGAPVRSPRETTQPNHADAAYWATGLTRIYLEGALRRALNPLVKHTTAPPEPLFDRPAPEMTRHVETPAVTREAVLDPFSVYEKGEALLRKELGALSAWHLVNIVTAYGLSREPVAALNRLSAAALRDIIVDGVTAHLPAR
jgi:hypothetical protein